MSFTSDEQLESLQDDYGLTLAQAHTVAAKAGVVRHLARHPERSNHLALKGGTLLLGWLDSPRVSIADVDYADATDGTKLTVDEVKQAVTFEADGLTVRGTEGTWADKDGLVGSDDVPYSLGAVSPLEGDTDRPLSISVSVRQGEVVGGIQVVRFKAPYIDEPEFDVPAVTLEEQLCEKLIGYSMKHYNKHIVDLAIAARQWKDNFDPDRVLEIFVQKAKAEKTRDPERFKNIHRVSDFLPRFKDGQKEKLMLKQWRDADKELFFVSDERDLQDPTQVLELAKGFWVPILDSLPDEPLIDSES